MSRRRFTWVAYRDRIFFPWSGLARTLPYRLVRSVAYNFPVMPELETRPSAAQRLSLLRQSLLKDSGFADVVEAVQTGQAATLDGVWGSACALVAAALAERSEPAPVVVVAAKSNDIDELVDGLRLFSPQRVATYPTLEDRPSMRWEDENYGDRLRTLKDLIHGDPPGFVVTSTTGLLQPTFDRKTLEANTRSIRVKGTIDPERLTRWLAEHRFHATSAGRVAGRVLLARRDPGRVRP